MELLPEGLWATPGGPYAPPKGKLWDANSIASEKQKSIKSLFTEHLALTVQLSPKYWHCV